MSAETSIPYRPVDRILFYRVSEDYGEFSNFSPHPFRLKGKTYKIVLHAVAIDGWYESSPTVITEVTQRGLAMAAAYGVKKVALTALATGFGRLSLADFAPGVRPLMKIAFPPIAEVVICLLLDFEVAELARHLPELECIPPFPNSLTH